MITFVKFQKFVINGLELKLLKINKNLRDITAIKLLKLH